jgi:hypothetical protein
MTRFAGKLEVQGAKYNCRFAACELIPLRIQRIVIIHTHIYICTNAGMIGFKTSTFSLLLAWCQWKMDSKLKPEKAVLEATADVLPERMTVSIFSHKQDKCM